MKQVVKHVSGMSITLSVSGDPLSPADVERVSAFQGSIFHNDLSCRLWMFDVELPSGRWLENIEPTNDLRRATAYVY